MCPPLFDIRFIHSFIYSITHSFTQSLIHSFVHSFNYFFHSFTPAFIPSFIHSFILWSTRTCACIKQLYVYTFFFSLPSSLLLHIIFPPPSSFFFHSSFISSFQIRHDFGFTFFPFPSPDFFFPSPFFFLVSFPSCFFSSQNILFEIHTIMGLSTLSSPRSNFYPPSIFFSPLLNLFFSSDERLGGGGESSRSICIERVSPICPSAYRLPSDSPESVFYRFCLS